MNQPLPRAIIFDWDNTLVDSWDAIGRAINHVRESFGQAPWTVAEIRHYCVRSAREIFPQWYGDEWEKACAIYYVRFDEIRKGTSLRPLAGAEDLLKWLQSNSIPAMIVSNRQGDYLRREVAMLGWTNYFAAVVGAQDALKDKPARDPIDMALGKAGLTADEAIWFIGDSDVDVSCARNAGCTPVLIGDKDTAARLTVTRVFSDCYRFHRSLYDFNRQLPQK